MSLQRETYEDIANPIDSVEDVLSSHNWVFNRMNDEELMVQVCGRACEYKLFFIWQENMNAMQFCCQFEKPVSDSNFISAAKALMKANENLWIGHFDLPEATMIPCFRHTCLFAGVSRSAGCEQIEDLVSLSLALCERYFPLFDILSMPEASNEQNLQLALMDTAGQS